MEKTLHSASKRAIITNGEARWWWSLDMEVHDGVYKLEYIESIMNKHYYLDFLKDNLKESATKLGLDHRFVSNMTTILSSAEIVKLSLLFVVPN
ncbi:hypothetical protein TNCV_4994451 [Trichonephila clavipes]|nr:hypothetical protein TNCV_4994451 [Trichonephila clavipes]